jgi:hypothetical protein
MAGARKNRSGTNLIPAGWGLIAAATKTIMGWPVWPDPPPLSRTKRTTSVRGELNTNAAELLRVVVLLGDEHGIGLEGVRLRMTDWAFHRLDEVTATLEVEGGRSFVAIARVDCWPADPHLNLRARKIAALRHLPREINGHHVHRYEDNARIGHSAFGPGPDGNLPAAAPLLERLTSFRDFLRTVGREFRIEGLDKIDPPNWQVIV